MAQQTAVEWFFLWFIDNPQATHKEYLEAFDKAKAMEKEQIIEAFKHGELPPLFNNLSAEQYYNETFKNK